MRTTGKQCGLAATGDYQPSLRSPWLAAQDTAVAGIVAVKHLVITAVAAVMHDVCHFHQCKGHGKQPGQQHPHVFIHSW
nr:hypothetical protein [Thiolapillus sp.]